MTEDEELTATLRTHRPASFGAGFATRVMQRTPTRDRSLGSALLRTFIWIAPAAVTAIAVLVVHNARASGRPTLDGLLSLPAVTLDATYLADSGATVP